MLQTACYGFCMVLVLSTMVLNQKDVQCMVGTTGTVKAMHAHVAVDMTQSNTHKEINSYSNNTGI